jgi:hypothetical protein
MEEREREKGEVERVSLATTLRSRQKKYATTDGVPIGLAH